MDTTQFNFNFPITWPDGVLKTIQTVRNVDSWSVAND